MSNTTIAYKQTEVGLIPSDWEVKELGELAEKIIGGGTPSRSNKHFWGNEIPWVTVKDFATFNSSQTQEYITKDGLNNSASHLIPKGIIITSTRMALGKAVIYDVDVSINQDLKAIFPKKSIDTKFFYYWFQFNSKYIEDLGSGSTVMGLSLPDLRKIKVKLPPTKAEQTAIATALSDADALISGLEKLIAKKRNIKQGAMQKLLQPKEGWEVKPFKEVCWFQEGPGLRNWQFTSRGIKVINVTNLENGYLNLERTDRHISLEEFHKMYEHFEIDENDIVVASSGNSYGKVAVVRNQDLPLLMNTSVIRFKPLKELDYNFLLTFLKSNQFKNQIDLLITGGAQPNFGPIHLNKITINLPPNKDEQIAIATILSDMDAEIAALEAKLEKYRKVKLGMMQNLLTGRIRLI